MVPSHRSLPFAILCVLVAYPLSPGGESLGLRVPPGFEVT